MLRDLWQGTAAGAAATVPMTALMEVGFQELPFFEQYSLPPRQITMNAASAVGVRDDLTANQALALTVGSHLAYGAGCGGLYTSVVPRAQRGVVSGVGFGLGVWAGSYLGLLPALGLLSPATRHPRERTALMIAAHVVWGGTLGLLTKPRPKQTASKAVSQKSRRKSPAMGR